MAEDNKNQVQILLDAVNNATAELKMVRQDLVQLDATNKQSIATTNQATEATNRQKTALAAASTQLKGVQVAASTTMRGLGALRSSMLVIGGTVAPQFTGAMMVVSQTLSTVREVSLATRTSIIALGSGAVLAGAAVAGTAWAWSKYSEAVKEAKEAQKAWNDQNKDQGRIVDEELRVLENMGMLGNNRAAIMGAGDTTAQLRAVRDFRALMAIGDDGSSAMRRQLEAATMQDLDQKLAMNDIALTQDLKAIETLDRKVRLSKDEVTELRELAMLAHRVSEDAIREADARDRASRAARAQQVFGGLQVELMQSQANAGADPVWGVTPEQQAQGLVAAEELAHMARLNMIAELQLQEDQAREYREAAEALHHSKLIEIERTTAEAKKRLLLTQLDTTANVFGQMAETAKLYGQEGFKVFKAFAITEAIISTYSSAVKAYDSVVGIPYVGPVLAPIAAAAAVAAGVANVSQIAAATPGYSTGGVVPGAYNGRDDRLIKVGPGEVILTPRQAQMIGMESIYAALSATGGKIPNRMGPAASMSHFNTGGIVTQQAGIVSNTQFNVGLISNRQEEREFQLRQGTRMILRELEQRKVRA